jgi:hypothetical protein
VVHIIVAGDVVDNYCFMFDTGVVHIVVACYIVDHNCFMFDTGVVHIIVAGDVVDRNGQQYHQSQQYEPFLCQT